LGGEVVFAAEVEHLLRLSDTADRRARGAAAPEDETECGDGVENEVEAARVLLRLAAPLNIALTLLPGAAA